MAKSKRYSAAERKAYWIGVGISMANHRESSSIMNHNSKIGRSAVAGYNDDNKKDVSGKLLKKHVKRFQ